MDAQENRAEAGNLSTRSREVSRGDFLTRRAADRAVRQESQLRASRMMLASRRDLPKLPLPVDTDSSTPALDAGRDHIFCGGINALHRRRQTWFTPVQRSAGAAAGCLSKGEGPS